MFKKINQKIKNWIFRDTENLKYLNHNFGLFTQVRYIVKNDFSYVLILHRTQDKIESKKLHKGNLVVIDIPFWNLPFITEKRIINKFFSL